jgi:protein ImuB
MRRLGLRRVGHVLDQPRAPFGTRFEPDYLLRLDQAIGQAPEPLVPVLPPPVYHARAEFLDPISASDHVLVAAERLLGEVCLQLAQDDAGARSLRLLLFRVDGGVATVDLGLAAASRDPEHVLRLFAFRLERLGAEMNAEFGFEAAALHVRRAEPLCASQASLLVEGDAPSPDGLAHLIDRLRQRLGPGAVRQLHPRQSHIPERAEELKEATPVAVPVETLNVEETAHRPAVARPILLLPAPEAAEVLALIPDGPPRQFRWRGVMHEVRGAEGPERIRPEWWRRTAEAERDYYVVEDTGGRRFWLYRHGLYGGEAKPQWFVHGVFA